MNRQEKKAVIESLKSEFNQSQAAFIVAVQGLTVSQIQSLRQGLRKEGGTLHVTKNTLARQAAESIEGIRDLGPYFKQQVAVVFAVKDPSSVAKVLSSYEKENPKFSTIAGSLEARLIDQSMIKFLGSLPSREVVVAQLCGTVQAPLVAHVSVLNQLIVRLLWVLQSASKK